MGRAARAGVRVGLFACLCLLCRERPPCEGSIPSVTAEGSEVKIWVSPCVLRAPSGAMVRSACPRGFPHLSRRRQNPKKTRLPHLFEETPTNRGVGLGTGRTERWSDRVK